MEINLIKILFVVLVIKLKIGYPYANVCNKNIMYNISRLINRLIYLWFMTTTAVHANRRFRN